TTERRPFRPRYRIAVCPKSALLRRRFLGYCSLALGTQLRLIVLQALLRLLALLTLTELLELGFARLGHLGVDLTTLGLRLCADAHCEGGHQDKICHFHKFPLPRSGCSYADRSRV